MMSWLSPMTDRGRHRSGPPQPAQSRDRGIPLDYSWCGGTRGSSRRSTRCSHSAISYIDPPTHSIIAADRIGTTPSRARGFLTLTITAKPLPPQKTGDSSLQISRYMKHLLVVQRGYTRTAQATGGNVCFKIYGSKSRRHRLRLITGCISFPGKLWSPTTQGGARDCTASLPLGRRTRQ
jgi:hypothetical protein